MTTFWSIRLLLPAFPTLAPDDVVSVTLLSESFRCVVVLMLLLASSGATARSLPNVLRMLCVSEGEELPKVN